MEVVNTKWLEDVSLTIITTGLVILVITVVVLFVLGMYIGSLLVVAGLTMTYLGIKRMVDEWMTDIKTWRKTFQELKQSFADLTKQLEQIKKEAQTKKKVKKKKVEKKK